MVVWHSPCESRTLPGTQLEEARSIERAFLLSEIQDFSADLFLNQPMPKSSIPHNGPLFTHLFTF